MAGVVLGAVVIAGFILVITRAPQLNLVYPALAVLAYYAISLAVSGCISPFQWAVGADGKLSVSKFQFLIWNATVLFSYVWIVAARNGSTDGIEFSRNVLYAMGFSIGTLAVAKGITVSYLTSGRVSKPPDSNNSNLSQLVAQDDGQTPDLVKTQMLLWTVIAAIIFLVETAHNITSAAAANALAAAGANVASAGAANAALKLPALPDIDATLMVLMGLGQAAYLGNKLVSSDVPVLTSIAPVEAIAGSDKVTIAGNNLWGMVTTYFGTQQIDVQSVAKDAASYQLTIPATAPKGNVQVSIAVDGVKSANALPLTIT
jgi:hypothetical protein